MAKVEQFIQLKDHSGILKNLSELLQEARDKNIKGLWLGFSRKDDSVRTFWLGDIAELNLLLDQMKSDFISGRFEDFNSEQYSDKET